MRAALGARALHVPEPSRRKAPTPPFCIRLIAAESSPICCIRLPAEAAEQTFRPYLPAVIFVEEPPEKPSYRVRTRALVEFSPAESIHFIACKFQIAICSDHFGIA